MRVMICMLGSVTYLRHTLLSRHTNFGIYQVNEMAARAQRPWHVNHADHDIHVIIFMLLPVIYVHHTVMLGHSNFDIHPINETARRAQSHRRLDR